MPDECFKSSNISKTEKKIYQMKACLLQIIKFIFSKKAMKIDEIFTVNLTFTTYRQIDGEDFVNFCGLLRKHEL